MHVCNICMYVCMYLPCTYWIPEFKALKSQLMKTFIALNETIIGLVSQIISLKNSQFQLENKQNSWTDVKKFQIEMWRERFAWHISWVCYSPCIILLFYNALRGEQIRGRLCLFWLMNCFSFLGHQLWVMSLPNRTKTGGIHSRHLTPRDHKQNYIIGSNKRLISQQVDWSEFKFSSWKFSLVTPPPPFK